MVFVPKALRRMSVFRRPAGAKTARVFWKRRVGKRGLFVTFWVACLTVFLLLWVCGSGKVSAGSGQPRSRLLFLLFEQVFQAVKDGARRCRRRLARSALAHFLFRALPVRKKKGYHREPFCVFGPRSFSDFDARSLVQLAPSFNSRTSRRCCAEAKSIRASRAE